MVVPASGRSNFLNGCVPVDPRQVLICRETHKLRKSSAPPENWSAEGSKQEEIWVNDLFPSMACIHKEKASSAAPADQVVA